MAFVQSEIRLLKKLDHINIVKYLASIRTRDTLYIVLEYASSFLLLLLRLHFCHIFLAVMSQSIPMCCVHNLCVYACRLVENGSVSAMSKKYGGHFPERLVALYICQVLEGLRYLHDQGVIHRHACCFLSSPLSSLCVCVCCYFPLLFLILVSCVCVCACALVFCSFFLFSYVRVYMRVFSLSPARCVGMVELDLSVCPTTTMQCALQGYQGSQHFGHQGGSDQAGRFRCREVERQAERKQTRCQRS